MRGTKRRKPIVFFRTKMPKKSSGKTKEATIADENHNETTNENKTTTGEDQTNSKKRTKPKKSISKKSKQKETQNLQNPHDHQQQQQISTNTLMLPLIQVEFNKNMSLQRTKLKNIITKSSKEYKKAIKKVRNDLSAQLPFAKECARLQNQLSKLTDFQKKNAINLSATVFEQMAVLIEDSIKLSMMMEHKLMEQIDSTLEVSKTVSKIETKLKEDLIKLTRSTPVVLRNSMNPRDDFLFDQSYNIQQNPIVFYKSTEIQNTFVSRS